MFFLQGVLEYFRPSALWESVETQGSGLRHKGAGTNNCKRLRAPPRQPGRRQDRKGGKRVSQKRRKGSGGKGGGVGGVGGGRGWGGVLSVKGLGLGFGLPTLKEAP